MLRTHPRLNFKRKKRVERELKLSLVVNYGSEKRSYKRAIKQ